MTLYFGKDTVRLVKTEVTGELVDDDASFLLTQVYENPGFVAHETKGSTEELVEAVYRFPLQGDSAVHFFKTLFLSETEQVLKALVGKAVEKEAAREAYDEAMLNGQTAQLLETDHSTVADVFTVSVGNIPSACKQVRVEIGYYLTVSTNANGSIRRLVIPATLAHYYGSNDTVGAKTENVVSSGSQLSIEVGLTFSNALSHIQSPTHKITTSRNVDGSPSKAHVKLSSETNYLTKDFVLNVQETVLTTSSLLFQDPGTVSSQGFGSQFGDATAAKLTFCIDEKLMAGGAKHPSGNLNFVFLVDCSGSMHGSAMENSKKALLLCLTSLPQACKFNICSFGSRYSFLFDKSAQYSSSTLERARKHVESLEANMGGTNILQPIKAIIASEKDYARHQTVIFLLTDGAVYDTDKIVDKVKMANKTAGTRLFSCGIGNSVSGHLVKALAEAGKGAATFIAANERMNAKLAAQMNQAVVSPYTNLRLEFQGLRVAQNELSWDIKDACPQYVYPGQTISTYAILEVAGLTNQTEGSGLCLYGSQLGSGSGEDVLLARIGSKEFRMTSGQIVVPALKYAITKVEQQSEAKKSDRKTAVSLAICANLVTKYTSLIAVDEEASEAPTEVKLAAIKLRRADQLDINFRTSAMRSSKVKSEMAFSNQGSWNASAAIASCKVKSVALELSDLSEMMSDLFDEVNLTEELALLQELDTRLAPLSSDLERVSVPRKLPKMKTTKEDLELQALEEQMSIDYTTAYSTQYQPDTSKETEVDTSVDKYAILDQLIRLQESDGSFSVCMKLCGLLGLGSSWTHATPAVMITAVVILFLEQELTTLKEEWKLMHSKAQSWLAANAANEAAVMAEASSLLK